MKEKYRDALAEIDIILKYADEESISKISKSFIEFIKKNKSDHRISIDPYKDLNEQNLLYETKVILSQMYIDYWSMDNERKILKEKEKKNLK